MNSYGKSSWAAEVPGGKLNSGKKDEFMKLQDGDNIVRIVTPPHQYISHKYKLENDPGFGEKISCSAPAHGTCPICSQEDLPKEDRKQKTRWFIGVIDRRTSSFKILDIGYTVFQAVKGLNEESDYGDPSNYDVNIKVNRQGGATGYYGVVPKVPKPLSADDLKIIEAADRDALVRRCMPPTPETVLKRVNGYREKRGLTPLEMPTTTNSAAAASQVVEMNDAHDFDFPAVD